MAKPHQNDARQKISLAPVKALAPSPDEASNPATAPEKPPALPGKAAPSETLKVAGPEHDAPSAPAQAAPNTITTKPDMPPSPQRPPAIGGEAAPKAPVASAATATSPADKPVKQNATEQTSTKTGSAELAVVRKPAKQAETATPTRKIAAKSVLAVNKPKDTAKSASVAAAPARVSNEDRARISVPKGTESTSARGGKASKGTDRSKTKSKVSTRELARKPKTPSQHETGKSEAASAVNVLKLKVVDRSPASASRQATLRKPSLVEPGLVEPGLAKPSPQKPASVTQAPIAIEPTPLAVPAIAMSLPGVTEATASILVAPALRAARLYAEAQSQILDHLIQEFSATLAEAEAFAKATSPSEVVLLQGKALRRRFESGTAKAGDLAKIARRLGSAA